MVERNGFLVFDNKLTDIKEAELAFKRNGDHVDTEWHPVTAQTLRFYTAYPWGAYVIHYRHLGTNNRWSDWYYTDPFFISAPIAITSLMPGQSLWEHRISGIATPYGNVQIVASDSHEPLSDVGNMQSGTNWTLSLYDSLKSGIHTVKVKHWVNGYTPLFSEPFTFDLRPAPVITRLPDVITVRRPIVSGRGEPGATVYIHIYKPNEQLYCGSATVQDNRTWSTQLARELPVGQNTLIAFQIKLDGISRWSDVVSTIGLFDLTITPPHY
jgi:hypothetical protein